MSVRIIFHSKKILGLIKKKTNEKEPFLKKAFISKWKKKTKFGKTDLIWNEYK
jgi:hypothetical protein